MKIFLLWPTRPGSSESEIRAEAAAVGERLSARFRPLFKEQPELHLRPGRHAQLAWLELPIAGFRAPFFEE